MSWLKNPLIFSILAVWVSGCGVKGDPLPPERPAELGRGRPTYKRATENIPIETVRPKDPTKHEDEDEDAD
jgi:hypothetical protein